jgi:uroporphyrinogen decarboxylase
MSKLSKRERVDAALKGEIVDRVPVSAWRHFIPAELTSQTLAEASLKHFFDFDWDWLKVNPRATYYAEAWGNQYDFGQYARVYPRFVAGPLNSPADLEKIREVDPTTGVFAEHIDLIRKIKAGIGGAHFIQTVFSPLSVLGFLAARPKQHTANEEVQAQAAGALRFIRENPKEAHEALKNIASTLSRYATEAVDAGASGLFFAIVKLGREDVLTKAEFEEFERPYDLLVLKAVQSAPFNMLHSCGPAIYFDAIADYPVHAINWATVGQNNPTVGEASRLTKKALVGGIDEDGALQNGKPDQVTQEALAAIRSTGGKHFLLAPGCGIGMDAPEANLHALRRAVE